jgi:hypothetical protein
VDQLARLLADAHIALQARDGSWKDGAGKLRTEKDLLRLEKISPGEFKRRPPPKKINATWIAKWLEEANWADEYGQDDAKKGVITNKHPSAAQLRQILKRLHDPRVREAAWKHLLAKKKK